MDKKNFFKFNKNFYWFYKFFVIAGCTVFALAIAHWLFITPNCVSKPDAQHTVECIGGRGRSYVYGYRTPEANQQAKIDMGIAFVGGAIFIVSQLLLIYQVKKAVKDYRANHPPDAFQEREK